jgi:hypothetical protein
MKFVRLLISASALIGVVSTAAAAQTTKPRDDGSRSSRNQEPATENGSSGVRVQSQGQAREPIDPVNTTSGGSPASSPQGDSPSGMQPLPKGDSTEDGHNSGDNR